MDYPQIQRTLTPTQKSNANSHRHSHSRTRVDNGKLWTKDIVAAKEKYAKAKKVGEREEGCKKKANLTAKNYGNPTIIGILIT